MENPKPYLDRLVKKVSSSGHLGCSASNRGSARKVEGWGMGGRVLFLQKRDSEKTFPAVFMDGRSGGGGGTVLASSQQVLLYSRLLE